MMMAGERGGSNLREKNIFLSHQEKKQAKNSKKAFCQKKRKEEETLYCLYDLFSCYYDT